MNHKLYAAANKIYREMEDGAYLCTLQNEKTKTVTAMLRRGGKDKPVALEAAKIALAAAEKYGMRGWKIVTQAYGTEAVHYLVKA